jgi:hypothetical protein
MGLQGVPGMKAEYATLRAQLIHERRIKLGDSWATSTDSEIVRNQCHAFCKIFAERFGLTIVSGFYVLDDYPHEHWWCVDADGNIIDPTSQQFREGGSYSPAAEKKYKMQTGTCPECGMALYEGDGDFCGEECFASYSAYVTREARRI